MNERGAIVQLIEEVFDSLETNSFRALGRPSEPMWDRPLVGIAAGEDAYYEFLKTHIGAFHWTPREVFRQKYGDSGAALSVVAVVFPQTCATKEMQRAAEVFPCDNWLIARREWGAVNGEFCQKLMDALAEQGIRSACPDLLEDMSRMRSERVGIASTWSHRHTAYAAGLGTFGLSDGLITERGIAVRLTSVVVEAELPADGRVSEDPYGWCSRCGACIRRCPAGAIRLEGGHDKEKCAAYKDYCIKNLWPAHIVRKGYILGCGLCQAGIPCTDHPPKQTAAMADNYGEENYGLQRI